MGTELRISGMLQHDLTDPFLPSLSPIFFIDPVSHFPTFHDLNEMFAQLRRIIRSKLVNAVLILTLCLVQTLAAESLFSAPAGWTELKLPNPDPAHLESVEVHSSPDEFTRVVVTRVAPMRTESGAHGMIKAQISTMTKGGYTHESTEDTKVQGYEARHLRGKIRSPDSEETVLSDNFAIFSDAAVLSVSIMVNATGGTRELSSGLLDRVTIPGKPVTLTADQSLSYRVGRLFGYIMIGSVVIFMVAKLCRGKKAT